MQIDYDPTRISYEELLEIFWESHNPAGRAFSLQYMTAIFYHNDEQERLARETAARMENETRKTIHTQILPATEFYLAEGYHQKHRLQQTPDLMREFRGFYPDLADIVNSTAAARVNGYLGGYGTLANLEAESDQLGLSPAGSERLRESVSRRDR